VTVAPARTAPPVTQPAGGASFFDVHDEMLAVLDRAGRFTAINSAFCREIGRPQAAVAGRGFLNVVPRADHEAVRQAFAECRRLRRPVGIEARFQSASGEPKWIQWQFTPQPDGRVVYVAGHDVTRRLELGKLKDEFVSVVSHELRTPLTSISGSLALVLGGVVGEMDPRANSLLEIAQTNCDRLVRLINDILDIEKIESGKMEFRVELVDVPDLLRRAAAQNERVASANNATIVTECDDDAGAVYGDPDRLMQVLTNLLSNAAKFSPLGGEITLRAHRDGGRMTIEVADRGPGIPEQERERIFERFVQVDGSDTRARGGTGLGLNIVRTIVERHQGTVVCEGREGGGSCFRVSLAAPDPGMSQLIPVDQISSLPVEGGSRRSELPSGSWAS
jgi:PAS domain S-box-containing protein